MQSINNFSIYKCFTARLFAIIHVNQKTTMSTNNTNTVDSATVHAMVSEYYSEDIKQTSDLKTSACLVGGEGSDVVHLLKNIHPDILDKFYGCGSPIPPVLSGLTVLDLGCGTGR